MGARGALGDRQVDRDLLVRRTLGDEPKHLDLARGQRLDRRLVSPGSHALGQDLRHLWVEVNLAGVRGAYCVGHLVRTGVLEQIARSTRLQGGCDLLLLDERGDGHYVDLWVRTMDGSNGAEAIQIGHEEIHQDHVGRKRIRAVDCDGSIFGLANDFEVVLQLEKPSQATPDDLVVINYQDLDAS